MSFRSIVLSFLASASAMLLSTAVSAGEKMLYQNDFTSPGALAGWINAGSAAVLPHDGIDGSGCVRLTLTPEDKQKMIHVYRNMELDRFAGRAVQLEGWIRGENVSTGSKAIFGPKLMLAITDKNQTVWLDQPKLHGTFPWTKFQVFARIPADPKQIKLVLGLENVTGTVFFSRVKIVEVPQVAPPKSDAGKAALQQTPAYRGTMLGTRLKEEDLRELAETWGANLVRFQMVRTWGNKPVGEAEYDQWLDLQLERLDQMLVWAKKYGFKVVVDLHSGPFMDQNALAHNRLIWNRRMNDKMVEVWQKIARRYKGTPEIYGYDLLNEPREDGYVFESDGPLDWNRLTERVAKAIREIDPDTPIIIEPAPWGKPVGLTTFQPIDVPNVIYSIHFYTPHDITHQGVSKGEPYTGASYPSEIKGVKWNKEQLRKMLLPAREFQLKWNVPIFVGEFGCIRWAPGDTGPNYLRDGIDLFEEFGWDWTFHAYREWDGWSVEHEGSEPGKPGKFVDSTPRKTVLLEALRRNRIKKSE